MSNCKQSEGVCAAGKGGRVGWVVDGTIEDSGMGEIGKVRGASEAVIAGQRKTQQYPVKSDLKSFVSLKRATLRRCSASSKQSSEAVTVVHLDTF